MFTFTVSKSSRGVAKQYWQPLPCHTHHHRHSGLHQVMGIKTTTLSIVPCSLPIPLFSTPVSCCRRSCFAWQQNSTENCIHCYGCGSREHFLAWDCRMRGVRQFRGAPLNGRRLLQRAREQFVPQHCPSIVHTVAWKGIKWDSMCIMQESALLLQVMPGWSLDYSQKSLCTNIMWGNDGIKTKYWSRSGPTNGKKMLHSRQNN